MRITRAAIGALSASISRQNMVSEPQAAILSAHRELPNASHAYGQSVMPGRVRDVMLSRASGGNGR
jgi:hypothetical protein